MRPEPRIPQLRQMLFKQCQSGHALNTYHQCNTSIRLWNDHSLIVATQHSNTESDK